MSLTIKFLSSIQGFLKSRDGDSLRSWLRVEPPVPQEYHNLTAELRNGYRDSAAVARLVEQNLPIEDDLPEDQGTAWPGFISFMKDYLEYWRDVDFDNLLNAHQLLVSLTNSCAAALNNPTYGSVLLQTSIGICHSLSKLSMTLNKRPDLVRKLETLNAGDDEKKSVIESTAEIIQKIFVACLSDRLSPRNARPEGKKVGVYIFANITLKLLFACHRTVLAKQMFTNISAKSPPLSFYPAAQRVTYLYYLGRFHFINTHYGRAARCLEQAYLQTPPQFQKHRSLILTYLIPANMILGRLPSNALLSRPEAQSMATAFSQLSAAVRTGNFLAFQQTLADHEQWLLRKGLLLPLSFRLRPLVWRSFSRKVFIITYVKPEADPSNPTNARRAITLELSHLLVAANYVQKRLEGYIPYQLAPKRPAPHTNSIFMKAVANNAATLVAPPSGKPKTLRPNEGLVWGNLPVTAEHVESVVASLVAQGLLAGYLAHAQGRFALRRAKGDEGPIAAGWPRVAEVTAKDDNDVPGWVSSL
ncbi:uncharacterized protein B0I36DRAFT_288975 [Microdochium trichocladiopsis]|uniref:PCI domain-containing protein n=1 Tax=Microdochium trichocladiopsis TaxID=1682393 RepID=A0A9P8Y6A7_9PEZI|nr:uncharacterized protein B0I36DRAFT_288975 [Microdochium trichocladiopsis]KAH7031121.1 hypothetical protein B0I36DRAFT_288975 [Microdochium trichocladiopsis]